MTIALKIPLNPPFKKGTLIPLFAKEGSGEISVVIFDEIVKSF
jgi:hypothetical protein